MGGPESGRRSPSSPCPGLAAFGIGPQHAGEIAAKAAASSSMQGNPVALSRADLQAIVLQAANHARSS
jgi:alcohol dehydrogenase class IV